jgi:WD40 repeat protein
MHARRALALVALLILPVTASWAGPMPRSDLRARAGPVLRVCYTPDGARLVSAHADMQLRVWDAASGSLQRTIRLRPRVVDGALGMRTSGERIEDLVCSPNGRFVAEATIREGGQSALRLWDPSTGGKLLELSDLVGLRCVAVHPDGALVALSGRMAGAAESYIALHSAADGHKVSQFNAPRLSVSGLAFSSDGKRLASFGGLRVQVWDVADGALLHTMESHKKAVQAVAWRADGAVLVSGDNGGAILWWDPASGARQEEVKTRHERVQALEFSPSGRTLASAGDDKGVRLWSAATRQEVEALFFHRARVNAIAFSPDGKTLASASDDEVIALWDVREATEVGPQARVRNAPTSDK